MRIIIVVLILWLLAGAQVLSGQGNPNLRFSHLTVEDGLSDGMVYDALLDSRGFMWIATYNGLDRYDGYNIQHFRFDKNDSTSISAATAMSLMEDDSSYLWVGTIGGGLNRLDHRTGTFEDFKVVINDPIIEGNDVTSIIQGTEGYLWIGTYSCGLQRFDRKTETFKRYDLNKDVKTRAESFRRNTIQFIQEDLEDPNLLWLGSNVGLFLFNKTTEETKQIPYNLNGQVDSLSTAMRLFMDEPGELWIGTWGMGLGRLNTKTLEWDITLPDEDAFKQNNYFANIINDIERKSPHELWLCSENQGLMIFNEETKTFQVIEHDPVETFSILTNKVNGIYGDFFGRFWIFNSQKGVSLYDPVNQSFPLVTFDPSTYCGEQQAEIIDFAYDPVSKYYYVTTVGCEYLFVFDEAMNLIQRAPLNPNLPASYDRHYPLVAKDGTIWIAGGIDGVMIHSLYTYNKETQRIVPFSDPLLEKVPIHQFKLTDIAEDELGNIWLGTMFGGLIRLNKGKNEVEQYLKSEAHPDYLDARYHISELKVAQNGKVWISTLENGVFSFDPSTEKFRHFPAEKDDAEGLTGERVITLAEDKQGLIWVGYSYAGIQVIDPEKEEEWLVETYTTNNGLPNNNIWKIVRDKIGDMWINTQYGLCRYAYDQGHFVQYTLTDGIRDPLLSQKGLTGSPNGDVLVGQFDGFYAFNPDQIYRNLVAPPVAFTGISVLGQEFLQEENINYMDEIKLKYDQNFFTINFAALNFTRPEKNRYAYILEGYDPIWIYPNNGLNLASYTKVPPGSYTFRLKAANNEKIWSAEEISLNIIVEPPYWKTWWAYLIYSLLALSIFYSIYRFQMKRRIAQRETERLKELNELKTKFYDNITHEFRTPLTVVLGYIERGLKQNRGLETSELSMMRQNGEQLLGLINQMLDLGKLDAGAMRSESHWENLQALLEYLTFSFESLAAKKGIDLKFQARIPACLGYLDKQKLVMVMSNLLSNAIKFTNEGGVVVVEAVLKDLDVNPASNNGEGPQNKRQLEIKVKDTGVGISRGHLPYIFDRFYQVAEGKNGGISEALENPVSGTGIGLALTKELVGLLEGTITVRSRKEVGTEFKVVLPLMVQELKEEENIVNGGMEAEDAPLVLLVEDNLSLISYISTGLKDKYRLIVATNGKEGLDKALDTIPDIIVSDVMMPEMDGFTLCERLKTDERTSHVPVILLTAKIGQQAKNEGLSSGADAYITKPFDDHELNIRIEKLIAGRRSLQEYYLQKVAMPEKSEETTIDQSPIPAVNEKDRQFLESVKSVIQESIDDPDLNVALLSKVTNLSHTQLHRKLVALIGLPPVRYIRKIRLQKARQLLTEASQNVAEVAYAVGFSDPAYFSKTFKSEFGISPRNFRQEKGI